MLPPVLPQGGTEVQRVLDAYDVKGGGFVSSEALDRLLDDLDFYFPGAEGSPQADAARTAFHRKLDFFGEKRRGVSSRALQVWWSFSSALC